MAEQRTPLHDRAVKAGARFQSCYGWELASSYGDVLAEYVAAREGCALHDSSYTGRIKASGKDVLDLLHRLSTNHLLSLKAGQGATTVLTTDRGRIIDLLTALNLGDHILLLTSPQTREAVAGWIDKYTIVEDVTLQDVTSSATMLSLVGPRSHMVLGRLAGIDLDSFAANQSAPVTVAGVAGHVLKRDLVSLPRFQIVVPSEKAEPVWEEIVSAGVSPIGLEAYEVLRVEEGEPGYGTELGEDYNPLEAGLWGSISFSKGCYIGQEVIARLDTYQKLQKHLVSLRFSPDALVEAGTRLALNGREVGHVTSAVSVPTNGELIGMGYVRKEAAEVGTRLGLAKGDGSWATIKAQLLPFGPGK